MVGCASAPESAPVRYEEDFAGAPSPFLVDARSTDGQISLFLYPGRCRRIAVGTDSPPHVVAEYPCRYPTGNVAVAVAVAGYPPFRGVTDPAGAAIFSVMDDLALTLAPTGTATLLVGDDPVAEVTLAPIVQAARRRAAVSTSPVPSVPAYGPPPPLPPSPPAASVAPRSNRTLDDDDILLLTLGICGAKMWTEDKCVEALAAGVGNDAATALCSAGQEYLQSGQVSPDTTAFNVAKARAARESDLLDFVLKFVELATCYDEVRPAVVRASQGR
jgi:hypothetical protein